MATQITVGVDPFDAVIRVNFDDLETGTRAQAEMDEDAAEHAAALFLAGRGTLGFTDTISGRHVLFPVEETNQQVASWFKTAASALRAHRAGEIDLRRATGKMPDA